MSTVSKMTIEPACYAELEGALVLFATLGRAGRAAARPDADRAPCRCPSWRTPGAWQAGRCRGGARGCAGGHGRARQRRARWAGSSLRRTGSGVARLKVERSALLVNHVPD